MYVRHTILTIPKLIGILVLYHLQVLDHSPDLLNYHFKGTCYIENIFQNKVIKLFIGRNSISGYVVGNLQLFTKQNFVVFIGLFSRHILKMKVGL